jgi:hypothetical protein
VIELAVNRLLHGDVRTTRNGTRVALREDLGDSRKKAKAYWPERRGGCRCWSMKSRAECSHEIAAALHRIMREPGP